jgi:hypothetical protein
LGRVPTWRDTLMKRTIQIEIKVNVAMILFGIAAIIHALI